MTDLLGFAIDAHGGLDRWNVFTTLRAELTVGGAIWDIKQQPGLLSNKILEIETHGERLKVTPFAGDDSHLDFRPERLSIVAADGTLIEERDTAANAFVGQVRETPWDKLHVAYFVGEALWTYLTSPFLYTYPGFETEEVEPWHENGEEWRRLQITFPGHIASHCRTQITHFGPDGLMRRHDSTVDILGGATGANYPSNYAAFQGLMMPTRRRIYAYDDTRMKVPEPLLVSLDFGALTFS